MLRRAAGLLVVLWAGTAHADFPPITNRSYAIDLYNGVALGDSVSVGMGGTGAAMLNGTAGVLINPSAIAVRSATDHDSWGIDYHIDYLTSSLSSDYDNNGQVSSGGAQLLTLGIGGRIHDWGWAITATGQTAPVGDNSGLTATAESARFVLAKWFPSIDVSIGVGAQLALFQLAPSNDSNHALFEITGVGAIAGATWVPHHQSFRVGASIDSPIGTGEVTTTTCDPANCQGFILPDRVRSPLRAVGGVAYRFAGSAWNEMVAGPFRDERALTLAADVVVTGPVSNGYGLEAFGQQELQPSGRHTVASLRGGADFEALPGRLRLRAGSYWEPARFDDSNGRLHATFGVDLRVFEFNLWGLRRGRLSALGDVARDYRNVGFSIGFWH